ncbi:MAG: hypothetical protein ICV71_01285 [Thermoleophilia bacterium]|nr:hypothetical protein [Thermoleophilia bacterium]
MVRVIPDPEPDTGPHEREELADPSLDDLLGSVRSLAWVIGPAAPRTVAAGERREIRLEVSRDGSAELGFLVENRQVVATPFVTALSLLRAPDGTVWAPRVPARTVVLEPGELRRITFAVASDLPPAPGRYRGTMRLLGVDGAALPVLAEVSS